MSIGRKMCLECRTSIQRVNQAATCLRLTVRISEGKSFKEIAFAWDLSEKTISAYWLIAQRLFGFHTIAAATRFALRHRLTTL